MMRLIRGCVAGCLLVFASDGYAEVLELEGTVKSVDAASRSISIVRKTPKGEKVLELEVAKNAGDISGFKEGDPVAFAYNPDVDIISKIEKGMSESASADMESLQGKWVATTLVISGAKLTKGEMQRHSRTFAIKGTQFTETIYRNGKVLVVSGSFKIDPDAKAFDFDGDIRMDDGHTTPLQTFGFYECAGDKVKLTVRKKRDGATRPTKYGEADEGKAWTNSFILERDE